MEKGNDNEESETNTDNKNSDSNSAKSEFSGKIRSKHFPHITALKQHYSKVQFYTNFQEKSIFDY